MFGGVVGMATTNWFCACALPGRPSAAASSPQAVAPNLDRLQIDIVSSCVAFLRRRTDRGNVVVDEIPRPSVRGSSGAIRSPFQ
jgi:hypothetical protein